MKYIGSYGEYLVLSELLKNDFEAYQAIKFNQENYDITIISDDEKIIRIQVKTTELQNNSTNNPIDGVDKNYDFLIIVVIDINKNWFYIIPKSDVTKIKNNDKLLYVSEIKGNEYAVRQCFNDYQNKWNFLKNFTK